MSKESHIIDPDKAHYSMRKIKQQHIDIFNYAKKIQSSGFEKLYQAWTTPVGITAIDELKSGLNSCMSGADASSTVDKVYAKYMIKLNQLIQRYCETAGFSFSTVSPEEHGYPFKKVTVSVSGKGKYEEEDVVNALVTIKKLKDNIQKNMNETVSIINSDFGVIGTGIDELSNEFSNAMRSVLERVDSKIDACLAIIKVVYGDVTDKVEAARKAAKAN